MFLIIGRTFKEGVSNFIRNGWLSVAAVTVMFLSVFVIGMLFVLVVTSNNILKTVEDRLNISIYFKSDATEDQIMQVKNELAGNSDIKSIDYISKDQALALFKQNNASTPDVINALDQLGDNPLPASLAITANDPSRYETIYNGINNADFKDEVSKVSYDKYKDVIDGFDHTVSQFKKIGLGFALIFTIISILIIFNTVRITIYTHRDEIEVMRLVGASNMFIRLPFIFEGIIYGLIAMIASTLVIFILFQMTASHFVNPLLADNVSQSFKSSFWELLGVELLSGMLLGVISSMIAMRKYLKI